MRLTHVFCRTIRRSSAVAFAAVSVARAVAAQTPPSAKGAQAAASPASAASAAPFSHALDPMDGSHLKVTVVEVRYGPGESSKAHSHPCPVIGYILEGSFRTQVRGEPESVYTAGQFFYEAANGAHVVSANASKEKPVRFLAYFTCDHDAPLVKPVPDAVRP
jgi:quercetin dioxygenase-like cupin family protein